MIMPIEAPCAREVANTRGDQCRRCGLGPGCANHPCTAPAWVNQDCGLLCDSCYLRRASLKAMVDGQETKGARMVRQFLYEYNAPESDGELEALLHQAFEPATADRVYRDAMARMYPDCIDHEPPCGTCHADES